MGYDESIFFFSGKVGVVSNKSLTSPCDPIAIDSKFQLRNTSPPWWAQDCFTFFPFLSRQAPAILYPLRVLLMSLKRIPDEFEDESVRCSTAIRLAYNAIRPWGMNRQRWGSYLYRYILSTYIAYIFLIWQTKITLYNSYLSGTTKIYPFAFLISTF